MELDNLELLKLVKEYILEPDKAKEIIAKEKPAFINCLLTRCKDIKICWNLETLEPNPTNKFPQCDNWFKKNPYYSRNTNYIPKTVSCVDFSYQEISYILLALRNFIPSFKDKHTLENLIRKLENVKILKGV